MNKKMGSIDLIDPIFLEKSLQNNLILIGAI